MLKINKNKRIGSVVFIVEGKNDEPKLLRDIFYKLLDYNIYRVDSLGNILKLVKKEDLYSRVAIVVNNKSQISSINSKNDYLDYVFRLLINNNIDLYNSAIYYLFDRDYDSNKKEDIIELFEKFNNSRENDSYDLHGLLLLSYPCLEAFYLNGNDDIKQYSNGKDIKSHVRRNRYRTNFNLEQLQCAVKEMLRVLNENINCCFENKFLDDMSDFNKIVLNRQDNYHKEKQLYITLSMISISLIDLGIVEL